MPVIPPGGLEGAKNTTVVRARSKLKGFKHKPGSTDNTDTPQVTRLVIVFKMNKSRTGGEK